MRYFLYLPICLSMELLSIPLAAVLPLLAHNARLPRWLSWFQTPDNSLEGDTGWQKEHWQWRRHFPLPISTYLGYLGWLLRNRAYGLKWNTLGAPVEPKSIRYEGDLGIKNRDQARAGFLRASMGKYWQYKRIWQIPGQKLCVMLNLGWQLDCYIGNPDLSSRYPKALYLFSPRISAFRPGVAEAAGSSPPQLSP